MTRSGRGPTSGVRRTLDVTIKLNAIRRIEYSTVAERQTPAQHRHNNKWVSDIPGKNA